MSGYLETKNLSVGYHGKPLIEDVSLCVQRGKIVTLIGPNGSGKSTILKTVIGQLPELSGTVYLDGETMRSRSRTAAVTAPALRLPISAQRRSAASFCTITVMLLSCTSDSSRCMRIGDVI